MPVLLEGEVRFPATYEPWYVYVASLVAAPATFQLLDILFPDSTGKFDRLVTDDAVLETGYVFALEKFTTGMTEVQCAIVGSAVPFIAQGDILPQSLVKFNFTGGAQGVVAAVALDLAAGKVIGRLRCHHDDHQNLRKAVNGDVVIISTGVV
jgi:hypothetical protein